MADEIATLAVKIESQGAAEASSDLDAVAASATAADEAVNKAAEKIIANFRKTGQTVADLKAAYADLVRTQGEASTSARALGTAIDALTAKDVAAAESTRVVKSAIDSVEQSLTRMRAATGAFNVEAVVANAGRPIALTTMEFQGLTRAMSQMSPVITRVEEEIGDEGGGVGLMGSLNVMRNVLLRLRSSWLAIGLAMGGVFAMGKEFVDFDNEMRLIAGLTNATDGQMEQLRQTVMKLGEEFGRDSTEVAKGAYFIESAGFSGARGLDTLRIATEMSAVGLGTVDESAHVLVSTLNAYRGSTLSAAEAANILIATAREGQTAPDQLIGAFGKVLPMASALKVQFQDVSASIAALTQQGLSPQKAATEIDAFFRAIIEPTGKAKKALDELSHGTLDFNTLAGELAQPGGILTVMKQIEEVTGGSEQKFMQLVPNARAARAELALVGTHAQQTTKIFSDLSDTTGTLDKAVEKTDGAGRSLSQSWTEVKNVMIDLGSLAIPMVATGLSDLIAPFKALDDMIKDISHYWHSSPLSEESRADNGIRLLTNTLHAAEEELQKLPTNSPLRIQISARIDQLKDQIHEAEDRLHHLQDTAAGVNLPTTSKKPPISTLGGGVMPGGTSTTSGTGVDTNADVYKDFISKIHDHVVEEQKLTEAIDTNRIAAAKAQADKYIDEQVEKSGIAMTDARTAAINRERVALENAMVAREKHREALQADAEAYKALQKHLEAEYNEQQKMQALLMQVDDEQGVVSAHKVEQLRQLIDLQKTLARPDAASYLMIDPSQIAAYQEEVHGAIEGLNTGKQADPAHSDFYKIFDTAKNSIERFTSSGITGVRDLSTAFLDLTNAIEQALIKMLILQPLMDSIQAALHNQFPNYVPALPAGSPMAQAAQSSGSAAASGGFSAALSGVFGKIFGSSSGGVAAVTDPTQADALAQVMGQFPGVSADAMAAQASTAAAANPGMWAWLMSFLADGGVISGSRLSTFASGGLVTAPTLFPMANGTGLMGEAGPEAIMPLTRTAGGALGVRATGGGGGEANVHVQVINTTGQPGTHRVRRTANGKQIQIMIGEAAAQDLRDGGPLSLEMERRFGASRVTTQR